MLSVVIPLYNCEETIEKCLESLCNQDYPYYEVIVVDDGSTDETVRICSTFKDVRAICLDNGGPSRARNMGVSKARGEIVVFTDGDCIAEKNWLSEIKNSFIAPEVAGVGGDQQSPEDETAFGKRVQALFKMLGFVTSYIQVDKIMVDTEHNPSCNAAYRKSVFEKIRGFDETLWPGEDVDLDVRIKKGGYRLLFNPKAVVRHYRSKTYGEFARMMRRYGASAWQLFKRYGFFRTLQYEPVVVFSGLVLLLMLVIWNPWMSLIIFFPWPLLFVLFFSKTKDIRESIRFIVLFLLILMNWNWGFVAGYRYRPFTKPSIIG